eukprot:gene473-599_t
MILDTFKSHNIEKALFFLVSASLSCFQPFLSIYLRSKDISPSNIGLITCLIPFLNFISTPSWALLADKYNIQKLVLLGTSISSTIILLLLIPVNKILPGIFILIFVYSILSAPLFPLVDSVVLKALGKERRLYGQQRLWGAISWGIMAAVVGILIERYFIDVIFYTYSILMAMFALVLFFTGRDEITNGFKRISSFSKIENNEINSNIELENSNNDDNNNDEQQKSNTTTTTSILVSDSQNQIEDQSNESLIENDLENQLESIEIDSDNDNDKGRLSTWEVIKQMVTNSQMMIFLFAILVVGMTANIIQNFLFLYLKDEKDASTILLGTTIPFTVVMELPFFFFGKELLDKVGVSKLIIMGQISFTTRLLLYNIFITNISPWFVLPIELLHGTSYASIWTAGVEYSNVMAPKGYETTYQGIFAAVYGGLGAGIGSIIGGFIYEHLSAMTLFRFAAEQQLI